MEEEFDIRNELGEEEDTELPDTDGDDESDDTEDDTDEDE